MDQGGTGQTPFVASLGGLRVINGVGPATRLGGLPLHPDVLEAMRLAVTHPVRMGQLQQEAGRRVAELLDVPGCYITSGAFAALTLATAVAIAGDDPAVADSLPRPTTARCEVVVQAGHSDPYDRALEAAGAVLVHVGYPHSTHPGELAAALGERTAAVLFRPGAPGDHAPLSLVCQMAHDAGALVIVDGALRVPPLSALQDFFAQGADFVAVSGGKGLRGPQASGLLCGRPDLIELVDVHHQDMDERSTTWDARARSRFDRPPRHGVGRGTKVGRDQVCGLVAAVERYVQDPGGDEAAGIDELHEAFEALQAAAVSATWRATSVLGVPEVAVQCPVDVIDDIVRGLRSHTPPIHVGESEAWAGALVINPMALTPGDGRLLADGIATVVSRHARASNQEEETRP